MGEALRQRLTQTRFDGPFHEALLNLLIAAGHVRDRLDRVCAEHEITQAQYNVLRILRGVHPEGYSRCEIARRMIDRAPDVTRLIDRLERQGWVERSSGASHDRRLSVTHITRKGLALLDTMRPAMQAIHRELASRLAPRDAKELSRLCERLYGAEE